MNVWIWVNQNHHFFLRATPTIITFMTMLMMLSSISFLLRCISFSDGFRIASVGNSRNALRYRPVGSVMELPKRSAYLFSVRGSEYESVVVNLNRNPVLTSQFCRTCHGSTTKSLYSTKNDIIEDKEHIVDDDNQLGLLYEQLKELSQEIRKHDKLYYGGEEGAVGGISGISDDEFDALVRREEEIEQNYPDLLKTWQKESGLDKAATRSGRVGTTIDSNRNTSNNIRLKRKHLTPMMSLDNAHNEDQLQAWLKRVVKAAQDEEESMVTIVTEPKLDGVSLSLRYEASVLDESVADDDAQIPLQLKWASTRGDGAIGQDVTTTAKQIIGIPDTIHLLEIPSVDSSNLALEVRGEVVLPRSEFLKIKQAEATAKQELMRKEDAKNEGNDDTEGNEDTNQDDPKAATIVSFSNTRNAASGILQRKESDNPNEEAISDELRSLLRFYAYDLSGLEAITTVGGTNGTSSSSEMNGIRIRELLSEWNFPLAQPVAITNVEWENTNNDVDSEREEESSEVKQSWDEWFQKFISKDQMQPILEYFSALEKHRERLQEEDLSSSMAAKDATTKNNKNYAESKYDWGDFDVDGCVHKITKSSMRSVMGYSMKSPKWAIAHKFPAQSSVTRLLDIVVQVGRTGALTPVAVLEPTEVGGVTVQRATLHNFGHLQEVLGIDSQNNAGSSDSSSSNNITRIPKYEPVLVQRAGDVIPQVVRRIHQNSNPKPSTFAEDPSATLWISLDPPKICPCCASPVIYETTASSGVGQVLRCNGPPLLCPPRAVTSLQHAYSRDALDVIGLSEARIEQLMDAGLLKYPSDVFTMADDQWETIGALPGWGEKSLKNLRDTSETVASKGITLGRFIYSLGIRHLGKHTSDLVASCYGSIGSFLESLDTTSRRDYEEIKSDAISTDESSAEGALSAEKEGEKDSASISSDHPFPQLENKLGIGPVAIASLLEFSRSEELTNAAKDLAKSLTILEQDIVAEGSQETSAFSGNTLDRPWKGFRVVFTGSLGIVEGLTRSRAQEIAKQLGAKATPGSVSKSTDLVVFGDKGGKKLTQAKTLGIRTISAEDFVKLAVENGFLDDGK